MSNTSDLYWQTDRNGHKMHINSKSFVNIHDNVYAESPSMDEVYEMKLDDFQIDGFYLYKGEFKNVLKTDGEDIPLRDAAKILRQDIKINMGNLRVRTYSLYSAPKGRSVRRGHPDMNMCTVRHFLYILIPEDFEYMGDRASFDVIDKILELKDIESDLSRCIASFDNSPSMNELTGDNVESMNNAFCDFNKLHNRIDKFVLHNGAYVIPAVEDIKDRMFSMCNQWIDISYSEIFGDEPEEALIQLVPEVSYYLGGPIKYNTSLSSRHTTLSQKEKLSKIGQFINDKTNEINQMDMVIQGGLGNRTISSGGESQEPSSKDTFSKSKYVWEDYDLDRLTRYIRTVSPYLTLNFRNDPVIIEREAMENRWVELFNKEWNGYFKDTGVKTKTASKSTPRISDEPPNCKYKYSKNVKGIQLVSRSDLDTLHNVYSTSDEIIVRKHILKYGRNIPRRVIVRYTTYNPLELFKPLKIVIEDPYYDGDKIPRVITIVDVHLSKLNDYRSYGNYEEYNNTIGKAIDKLESYKVHLSWRLERIKQ